MGLPPSQRDLRSLHGSQASAILRRWVSLLDDEVGILVVEWGGRKKGNTPRFDDPPPTYAGLGVAPTYEN